MKKDVTNAGKNTDDYNVWKRTDDYNVWKRMSLIRILMIIMWKRCH